MTISKIIKELEHVPKNQLGVIYQMVHALAKPTSSPLSLEEQKEILSFAGSFSDMNEEDYNSFVLKTKEVRASLFDRNIEL
jgi:hypothetical protein